MGVTMLILVTLLLPLVWGWAMYWLIVRLWPARDHEPKPVRPPGTNRYESLPDYQI